MNNENSTMLVALFGLIAPSFLPDWLGITVGCIASLYILFQLIMGIARWNEDTQKREEEKERREEEKQKREEEKLKWEKEMELLSIQLEEIKRNQKKKAK